MTTNELALELDRLTSGDAANLSDIGLFVTRNLSAIIAALRPQPDGDAVERVKQAISRAEIDKPQRSLSYYLGVGIDASGHDFARHDALITIAAQAAIAAMPAKGRDEVLEEAARVVECPDRTGREWVPNSLWGNIARELATAIRALKSGGR